MLEISTLINSPAGSFFYQLTMMLILFGALIVLFSRPQRPALPAAGRLVFGFALLLLLRLVLSGASLGSNTAGLPSAPLPVLERGLTTAAWIVLVWLWAVPEKSRAADGASLLLGLLAVALTGLSLLLQIQSQASGWIAPGWSIFSLLILGGGIVLLVRLKPDLWGYGLAMLALLFLAEAAGWAAFNLSSDASVVLRLAQLAAFPILLTLPQRINAEPVVQVVAQPVVRPVPERKRINLPPAVMNRFLALGLEADLLTLCRGIAEAVSYALVADICLVISKVGQLEEIIIYCGYDQVLEQELPGARIPVRSLPMISSAMQKNTALRLPASSASSDLKALSSALRLPKSGHLLVAPIPGGTEVGALVLLTPYSSRTWSQDDQAYLAQAAETIGALLDRQNRSAAPAESTEDLAQQLAAAIAREQQAAADLQLLRQQIAAGADDIPGNAELVAALETAAQMRQDLQSEIEALRDENDRLESQLADRNWDQTVQHLQAENIQLQLAVQDLETETEDLRARSAGLESAQKEALSLVESLRAENDRLKSTVDAAAQPAERRGVNGKIAPRDNGFTENELKEALREIAHLRSLLGESEIKIAELENLAAASSNVTQQWDMIITLAEEMRQPMSSILGYSDFLLSESVGLLGALQRKFLERVKVSTNRMSAMVEDLIHIAASESGRLKLTLGTVDLSTLIDTAISSTTVQLREKNIGLRVKLPEDVPTLEGDREAIRLILVHLLHNAAAVTPNQGDITIEIQLEKDEEERSFIQLRVSDSGGGIAPEDLHRVFERRFKSRDQLIKGLGVSNTGLAIAKTLVEAHGGRIWVDNRTDRKGAIFSILLPLHQDVSSLLFGKRGP